MGFALIARDRVKVDGPFAQPAFPLVALHAGAVVAPIALYFYAVHPAWSWMYFVDPRKLAGVAVVPLMVAHAALVVGAWYASALVIRRGLASVLLYATGAVAVFTLVFAFSSIHRLSTAADYPGFVTNHGISLFAVQLGWAFLVSMLALFGSAIYVAIELGRDNRRVQSR